MKIPFDIKYRPQIESGEYKVFAYEHEEQEARIICWDNKGKYPIIALIDNEPEKFDKYGRVPGGNRGGEFSLFIITPEQEEPDLTGFESGLFSAFSDAWQQQYLLGEEVNVVEWTKEHSAELLSLAREQFIKDGYVIEKKAFHDAVKKVDPEVMKEVSENMDNTGLTEFERRIKDLLAIKCEIFYNEDIGGCYDLKGLCRVILECAREQLKPDINSMLESNYKTAYKEGYDEGRTDALKDLPKWKEIGQGNNYSSETEFCINGRYLEMNDTLNSLYEIALKDLEKLPKEDEE